MGLVMIERMLRQAEPFRELEPPALAEIARHASERRLAPGEALFEQGEPADRYFLITQGRLKVTMIVPEGKQVLVRLAFPGDFCGLALALARPDYPASALAVVASDAISWPTDYWPTMIETYPAIAIDATRVLGRHVAEVHARLAELSTIEVERRVAHAVLRLTRRAGVPAAGGGVRVDFPVTRQDLAELTGTTLHSVSRIISGWGGRGIVGRGRARLVVHDLSALERIAESEKA